MFARVISGLAAALSMILPGAAWAASGVEVLVDRRDDQVSVYLALPAPELETLFGQGAERLLDADGTVDIDGLYDGTYLVADDIFAGATLRVGGETVPVEALSMMLHDPAFLPGFSDPYDAQVSIAVCTSPETVRGMTLPELRAFLGYFAWEVDGHTPVEITFPETGRGETEVTVRDFVDFRLVGEREVALADGGTIVLEAAPVPSGDEPARVLALGGMALAVLLASFAVWKGWRRRPTDIVRGS